MKKLLLALFSAVLAISASAQTVVTFNVATDKGNCSETAGADVVSKDGITIKVSNGILGNGTDYRCYKGKTLEVSSTIGNIASIEFTCTASGTTKYGPGCFAAMDGYSYADKVGTWTGDAESVTFTASSNQVRMTSITVTTAAAAGTVAKPTIKPASGTYYGDLDVIMSAAEGCTIKYTIKDDDDKTEYTYDMPLVLEAPGDYTIVAYAEDKDGKKSDEVTMTYDLKEIVNYTSIADIRKNCIAASQADAPVVSYTFTDLLVTGVSGSNVFVTDGSDSYLLYGTNAKSLKKGDKISGKVTGDLYQYNTLGELAVSDSYADVTVDSSDNEVSAKTVSIDNIVSNYATCEASIVKLSNVTFNAETIGTTYGEANYRIVEIEDAEGDNINIYDVSNTLKNETFLTTKNYDVTAYVVRNKGVVQVYVLSADDIKVITDQKDPELSWLSKSVSATIGSDKTLNKATTKSDGKVTYSSSDESVATIDAEGNITLVSAGKCTITATVAETENYLPATASFELIVVEKVGGLSTFTNGGFEAWSSDSQPKGWLSSTSASNATLSKSTEARSGEYSVCVQNATANKRLASKEFILDEGWYTMQFYAKSVAGAENKAKTCPGYAPYDDETGKLGSYSYGDYTDLLSTTEWTLVTYTFHLDKVTQINLVVMNPKASKTTTYGDLLIDDFEFREATEAEIATAGISSVKADTEDGAIYNVAGQKVNADYRGIIIKNGKKYLNK